MIVPHGGGDNDGGGGRAARRRERVAALVVERGSVTIDSLVDELAVSRMTVHRDLDDLEEQGILRKVRGGATAERSTVFESNVGFRLRTAVREKQAVARVAVELVTPGQAIMLDESTTMLPLVDALGQVGPLTVISNFVEVQRRLAGQRSIAFIGLGGDYVAHSDAFHGLLCEQAIRALHADVAFLSTSALDAVYLYHQEAVVVATKRAMLDAARRKVLLVDSGKLDGGALYRVDPIARFDQVIVDAGATPAQLRALGDTGVEIVVAPL
jgi:DeoR/GlpR family transcriptional regulator of sugar metabolism